MSKKYVYYFGDGLAEGTSNMKELLGGKGAGLAEMTNLGISVPPGFTISTEACVEYYKNGKQYPSGMWNAALKSLKRVERSMGMGFGDPERPLLVSVRSGARASMPGMMDTVLNVGLTTKTVEGWRQKHATIGLPRTAIGALCPCTAASSWECRANISKRSSSTRRPRWA